MPVSKDGPPNTGRVNASPSLPPRQGPTKLASSTWVRRERVKSRMQRALRGLGYQVVRYRPEVEFPLDFDEETIATIKLVRPFTMTPPERIYALCKAIRYVADFVPGEIVECGVWRGGSMMAAARTLIEAGDTTRQLYLFDTFEGMVEPGEHDLRHDGVTATNLLARDSADRYAEDSAWCAAHLEDVHRAVASVGYPVERIRCVKGRVEETVPYEAPEEIALLRLDTDWYESTRHELVHLFPRISPGGVLIIDDYGFWQGARRAVDEFLAGQARRVLLNRIDESGRIAVVP